MENNPQQPPPPPWHHPHPHHHPPPPPQPYHHHPPPPAPPAPPDYSVFPHHQPPPPPAYNHHPWQQPPFHTPPPPGQHHPHAYPPQNQIIMNSHPRGGSGNLPDNSGLGKLLKYIRQKFYLVLLCGPMPNHIAFIMDGNRRFSKSRNMDQGGGHRVGYSALLSTLQCCYEMNVKYVTVYAFSIDNFKRNPDEVEGLMSLMLEKIEELLKEDSFVRMYNVKINFFGNLGLLKEPVKLAAENAMRTTATNTGSVLSICVAYTSTNEIVHAVNESCRDKYTKGNSNTNYRSEKERKVVTSYDIQKFLYTEECPDPDIVVRTSGETRLSNFLLWQTPFCHLQNPSVLWPNFSFKYLIWTILEYQRVHPYLTKRKRKE